MNARTMAVVLVLFSVFGFGPSVSPVSVSAQSPKEYVGTLKPDLIPGGGSGGVSCQLKEASAQQLASLPKSLTGRVMTCDLKLRWLSAPVPVALVEPAAGQPTMYADTNRHGAWTDADALTCTKKTGQSRSSAVSDQFVYFLPLPPSSPWRALPLTVAAAWKTPNTDNRPPDFLFLSGGVTVEGSVSVGGHDVLVRYADNIDVTTGVIDPTHGIVQMDSNGDGRIDSGNYSLEFEMPHGASPVFHVGSVYLATKTVDPRTKTVVLVEHPASDYLRIPMVLGTQVPDLTFTDFNGATRRLSDFKGKYVLLDFWGTWCGPCVADIPELVKVYEQYRGRGVEILGMDNEFTGQNGKNPDEMTAQAKTLLAEKGATWTQARTESVEPIEDRFRIGYHPMYMLLDPDRHIVFWNEPGQQAVRAVAETLDRVLPKGGTSGR